MRNPKYRSSGYFTKTESEALAKVKYEYATAAGRNGKEFTDKGTWYLKRQKGEYPQVMESSDKPLPVYVAPVHRFFRTENDQYEILYI